MEPDTAAPKTAKRARRSGPLSRLWRRIRKPIGESQLVRGAIVSTVVGFMRFVRRTSPQAAGSVELATVFREHTRSIYALWHGQHLLGPVYNPPGHSLITMFSRSADAELNARVAERFGMETVRGSGGREPKKSVEKGGARALIALKKALDRGSSVCMIADIPHGEPRQAGLGVITLARISGRPIIGVAIATSRRKVFETTWDKTTLNLPFGRTGTVVTDPLYVPADASEADMERIRVEFTELLNAATREAYRLADAAR